VDELRNGKITEINSRRITVLAPRVLFRRAPIEPDQLFKRGNERTKPRRPGIGCGHEAGQTRNIPSAAPMAVWFRSTWWRDL